jgi:predicted aldo/keto reductase-like oxidoreductase
MKYRELGRTGIKVSEIGIGCVYFDEMHEAGLLDKVIGRGIDAGMNLLDVCLSGLEIRDAVGKAIIHGRRDELIIQGHIGLTLENGQDARTQDLEKSRAHIEDLLARLRTDHIDITMLHCIDRMDEYKAAVESGLIEYMLRQKEEGVFRSLGFSSHEPDVASAMIKTGHFDVVMFSVNPLFDLVFNDMDKFFSMPEDEAYPKDLNIDPRRAAFYNLCVEKGIGIVVMKALAAGSLVDPLDTPFAKAMTVPQCLRYALNRPAVAGVLLGYRNVEQVETALSYYTTPRSELDYSEILNSVTGEISPKCLYCNHCLPCASRINIGEVTRLADSGASLGVSAEIRSKYDKLSVKPSACTKCGLCLPRCPFGIDVVENMNKAKALFEA